ncbi:26S proteasome non-ATPase regulatory subunit 1 [Lepeophtheirus salmonis]|nr:26S proteasome non-ATPase regulatory subunit 1-like [Lepeophtheirus salmonis]
MPTSLSSAGGILALLEEPMPELKVFALKKLEGIVDEFWAEISESIGKIEILHEEEEFPQRSLAALIASKVYYHLGSYDDSLHYALGAGSLFDVHSRSQYVETTIAKIIDSYISKRNNEEKVNEAQEGVVNRMFERCLEDGEYKQALGIAIEARRLDVFQRAIKESNDENGMLSYAFRVSMTLIQNRTYRATLLRVLIDLYRGLEKPDYVQMCQCLIFLDDPQAVAGVLETLSKGSSNDVMMAYQIAFDMYESATQQFLNAVVQAIRGTSPVTEAKEESTEKPEAVEEDTKMEESSKPEEDEQSSKSEKLISILSGKKTIYLHLQFLIRNDHSDLLILKQTKDAVRVSICHTATVIANGLMHCGTTHDSFLRDNLEWLSRATNWAKLSATASLGVIHRGHERDSLSLMQSYLPKDSANSSGYAEGGGLYALGLIHANHGGEITEYLLNQLKEGGFEQLRHGGCLGLGLAAMGTHRADVYEQLKYNLFQDDAVVGEAAGLAMGLVQLGSKDATAIEDMVAYAHETQHEKILRGLAVGISLVMYGLLEEADPLIDSLCSDKDAILRRSGMYTIAMAYCGTGSNKAIRRLLHVAVSDVNDDVRRAAVMGLGFILFKTPDHCPGVVSLLSESYNPHVRYGAAMALGIACAGTGSKEAIALIEPMTNDPVNYVRQGAWIASALILIQHTEFTCPKVKDFRALYAKVIGDKHEDVMAKFGAILAQGIIDGGGRNVTVSLQSRTGHTNMVAVVGMLVFTQYWYWFPLSHFLGLAFTPSCLIGLNNNLDMPVVTFKSNAKPSVYGYPAMLEEKKKEDKEKVATAVLSITHKQKRKDAEKRKKDVEKMEVDEKEPVVEKEKTEKKEEKRKDEPHFETLSNPARVMKQQLKLTHIEDPTKYKALKDTSIGGIIMMNNQTGEKDEIVEPVQVKKNHVDTANDGDEPEPPEPFEYIED